MHLFVWFKRPAEIAAKSKAKMNIFCGEKNPGYVFPRILFLAFWCKRLQKVFTLSKYSIKIGIFTKNFLQFLQIRWDHVKTSYKITLFALFLNSLWPIDLMALLFLEPDVLSSTVFLKFHLCIGRLFSALFLLLAHNNVNLFDSREKRCFWTVQRWGDDWLFFRRCCSCSGDCTMILEREPACGVLGVSYMVGAPWKESKKNLLKCLHY